MKKYYTKFIEVEGKIVSGDWCRWLGFGEIFKCQENLLEEQDCIIGTDGIPYIHGHDPHIVQKVKLFLCTRDIKPGDKLWAFTPDLVQKAEVEFIEEITWTVDDKIVSAYKCIFPTGQVGTTLSKNTCKVIGLISSDATWVKEGDEFDEEDWRVVTYDFDELIIIDKNKINDWDNKDYPINFQIKGPCGHFH